MRDLQRMLTLKSPRCSGIPYARSTGTKTTCARCGRPVVKANTRSGWRHA